MSDEAFFVKRAVKRLHLYLFFIVMSRSDDSPARARGTFASTAVGTGSMQAVRRAIQRPVASSWVSV
jgi:hypothetical protein